MTQALPVMLASAMAAPIGGTEAKMAENGILEHVKIDATRLL
jgi:hypothetical protein